jgi:hypothetical protein
MRTYKVTFKDGTQEIKYANNISDCRWNLINNNLADKVYSFKKISNLKLEWNESPLEWWRTLSVGDKLELANIDVNTGNYLEPDEETVIKLHAELFSDEIFHRKLTES